MSFQTPITISNAIEDIDNHRLLLPAIQREFVWSNTKIEWLFDSIMRHYPISSFLFWQVEGDTKTQYKYYGFLKQFRERFQTHNEEYGLHPYDWTDRVRRIRSDGPSFPLLSNSSSNSSGGR